MGGGMYVCLKYVWWTKSIGSVQATRNRKEIDRFATARNRNVNLKEIGRFTNGSRIFVLEDYMHRQLRSDMDDRKYFKFGLVRTFHG